MKHYIIEKHTITVNKDGNENYDLELKILGDCCNLLKRGWITQEFFDKLTSRIRGHIGTKNYITISKTEVENKFEVFVFDLEADNSILTVKYDKENNNWYIEKEI